MKKLIWLILPALLFAGCGREKEPEPQKADFKVEFSQLGDYKGFYRFISMDAEMVFEGTDTAPLVLESKDLPDNKYTFVTSKPIKSLTFTFLTSYDTATNPSEFVFKVFKNGKLIDTKTVKLTASDFVPKNFAWVYQANE